MEPEIKQCRVQLGADAKSGEVVAIVASYNVPDMRNDILRPGCFTKSIAAWRQSGDRMPICYSHDSHAIIGDIDPTTGFDDSRTALIVRGQLDMADPEGVKVHRLLSRHTLREWSFAAFLTEVNRLPDGSREITEAALVEVGPCLKGIGRTATLAVKSAALPPPRVELAPALLVRHVALAALDRRVRVRLVDGGAR